MEAYIGHSSSLPFKKVLYEPLKNSELYEKHSLVFPHEESSEPYDSKAFLRDRADVFISEVSRASTGLGIELGWADEFGVPILCVHHDFFTPSGSLQVITDNIESYNNSQELITIVEDFMDSNQ